VLEYHSVFEYVGFFCRQTFYTTNNSGVIGMSGKTDEIKGRVKEVAGALTGNDELRAEGKTDQAIGQVKQIAAKAVDKIENAVKNVRD
jgi:uncharacterized protein YjbJ (UPF0337 family)